MQQFLGGNFDPTGQNGSSTFGATARGQALATGDQQSFFAGEDYRNQLINQLFGRRNQLFGQDVALGQQQNQADINQQAQINQQTGANLGGLNSFYSNLNNTLGNFSQQYQNQQQAQAANKSNFYGGLLGTGLGLANLAVPGIKPLFGAISGGFGGGTNGLLNMGNPYGQPSLGL